MDEKINLKGLSKEKLNRIDLIFEEQSKLKKYIKMFIKEHSLVEPHKSRLTILDELYSIYRKRTILFEQRSYYYDKNYMPLERTKNEAELYEKDIAFKFNISYEKREYDTLAIKLDFIINRVLSILREAGKNECEAIQFDFIFDVVDKDTILFDADKAYIIELSRYLSLDEEFEHYIDGSIIQMKKFLCNSDILAYGLPGLKHMMFFKMISEVLVAENAGLKTQIVNDFIKNYFR